MREHAGVFDVSHMGQVADPRSAGDRAAAAAAVQADLRKLPKGGAQYSVICNERTGACSTTCDHVPAGRVQSFLTVTNAANHERDLAWFSSHVDGYDADVIDLIDRFAMLAVQGPAAPAIVRGLADGPLPGKRRVCERSLTSAAATICGTGYTGEDGVELLLDPADAPVVWDALIAAGVVPAGLGARDTLRIEACLPLYGNELSEERGPIEAGLGWCCADATGFIGSAAVARGRKPDPAHPAERLAAFVLDGPGIPRSGNPVIDGGIVTSGTLSPSLGRGIGMAYLPAARATPGTRLTIDVRGSERAATVTRKPIYSKEA